MHARLLIDMPNMGSDSVFRNDQIFSYPGLRSASDQVHQNVRFPLSEPPFFGTGGKVDVLPIH